MARQRPVTKVGRANEVHRHGERSCYIGEELRLLGEEECVGVIESRD